MACRPRAVVTRIGGLAAALLCGMRGAHADCPAAEPLTAITCSADLSTPSMVPAAGTIDGPYSCGSPFANVAQPGPEDVYTFSCQVTGNVTIQLSGSSCDHDLYVLGESCDPASACVAGSTSASNNDSLTFPCAAGQDYRIVVEWFACSGAAPYALSFEAGAAGGCREDCDNGVDDDANASVDCDDSRCANDPVCAPVIDAGVIDAMPVDASIDAAVDAGADAAVDATTTDAQGIDAGPVDAQPLDATFVDAAQDASAADAPLADAPSSDALALDASTADDADGGCGCDASQRGSWSGVPPLVLALAVVAVRRRRRQRS